MTKILTIIGTRPEIIRLSVVMKKLDTLCDHYVLHTGQNYDKNLNDIFFNDLKLRQPNKILDSRSSSVAEQIGKIFKGVEETVNDFKPDKVLILGDTNSCLSAVICERMGIPVYHMEAGNRCYDLNVPEEKNRKIIDSISSVNLPYTELSRQNLLREGIPNNKIFVIGNPIKEVIDHYKDEINASTILEKLNLQSKKYIISTAHRAENVDNEYRLKNIFLAFEEISKEYQVVFSCHPRTKEKIEKYKISNNNNILIIEPVGFFDFVKLEQNSFAAITDSGTVQEEMCIFNIPTLTIRDSTERPETVWCGSNIISGLEHVDIISCYHSLKSMNNDWQIPHEYLINTVSQTVVNLLVGKKQ